MRSPILLLAALLLFSLTAQAQFVGSKNSNKYHSTDCQWAKRISSANLITFKTADDATKAGYVPCKVCSPTEGSSKSTTVAPSKPAQKSSGRCQATTKKGTQCSRKAQAGSQYCWQHQR